MKTQTPTDKENIELLCPELRQILNAELEAGNQIMETARGWPGTLCIMLRFSFCHRLQDIPNNVEYREINDIHYWKAEYNHKPSGHVLTCGFPI